MNGEIIGKIVICIFFSLGIGAVICITINCIPKGWKINLWFSDNFWYIFLAISFIILFILFKYIPTRSEYWEGKRKECQEYYISQFEKDKRILVLELNSYINIKDIRQEIIDYAETQNYKFLETEKNILIFEKNN